MEKNYQTLAQEIEKNGFELSSVAISGKHIMALNEDGKHYICHLNETINGWTMDGCKTYGKEDAIRIMMDLMKQELKD